MLGQVNSKILLPEHLTKEQSQLVYKKENKARLEAEPMEITLGDVTLPLEHIDRMRDKPKRKTILRKVMQQSETPADWENVVRMLEGFHNAAIRINTPLMVMTVRRLNEAGMHHLVLKALQRAEKTGLRLKETSIVHQVFKGLHDKAARSAWDEAETTKALSFSEQVVELMENKEHLGRLDRGRNDLRASPWVIAVPLELAAARAKRHTDGQDKDGKVLKYASRLMNALHQDDFNTVSPYRPPRRSPRDSTHGFFRSSYPKSSAISTPPQRQRISPRRWR